MRSISRDKLRVVADCSAHGLLSNLCFPMSHTQYCFPGAVRQPGEMLDLAMQAGSLALACAFKQESATLSCLTWLPCLACLALTSPSPGMRKCSKPARVPFKVQVHVLSSPVFRCCICSVNSATFLAQQRFISCSFRKVTILLLDRCGPLSPTVFDYVTQFGAVFVVVASIRLIGIRQWEQLACSPFPFRHTVTTFRAPPPMLVCSVSLLIQTNL